MKSSLNFIAYHLWLADAPLTDPQDLNTPAPDVTTDPLIDKGGQIAIRVGAILLICAISSIIGVLSRRIEHALFVALVLSSALIVVILLPSH